MLGERIANLRKEKGISQEELADVLLTSRQAISKWERCESEPDIGRLKDLAVIFNVSIDYLLDHNMETISVSSFIERAKKCVKKAIFDISLDEIRIIISRNKNNYNLLISVIEYLSEYYLIKREDEVANLLIEYVKNAIILFQPSEANDLTLNDLHRIIVQIYIIKKEYELAKTYIKENKVGDINDLLAECEFNLGHYEETEKITSDLFLKAFSLIIISNFIQIRIFLRNNEAKEALDLVDWTIKFVGSAGKNEDTMLNVIYSLYFMKAVCQKDLNIDYLKSLEFLKENKDKLKGYVSENDGIKFYNNKRIILTSSEGDIKKEFLKEINELKKIGLNYKNVEAIYNEVYGGDEYGRKGKNRRNS